MVDRTLSETLSARYYQPGPPYGSPNEQSQRRKSPLDTSGSESVIRDNPRSDDEPKKRGRPRMSSPGGPRMDRRTQIRCAQRTYRHKKEVMFRTLQERVAELEENLNEVSDSLFAFYTMAIGSDLHITHPKLFHRLKCTVTQLQVATGGSGRSSDPGFLDSESKSIGGSVSPEILLPGMHPPTDART
ncbi:hypothetical protein P175DRAFT_0534753 [Aspergillus ochraceoroseus IBT 24754]|uniref:BZIP domain-containing protein n=1 Tax=Aspergillus ochraceoroseus IBT 24754 TaxID=1392256 RepID=A0A2T5LRR6_9EURO|nr:uncharacterized protein P175DRAFT_0534753 [Aspergillus ochraceoroseus IBT 24754]PTU18970.1 hypothetical protein P175DRAFT_0534753 [Aspergillus ochraceoroseus IBT 24754]